MLHWGAAAVEIGVATFGGVYELEACGMGAKTPPSTAGDVSYSKSTKEAYCEAVPPRFARSPGNNFGTNSIAILEEVTVGRPVSTC